MRGAVRYVQNVLLVVGATALGAGLCGLGVLCCLVVVMGGSSGRGFSGMAAAGIAMFSYAIGTALGALAGFAAAVRWVMTHESQPWKPRVWHGVALGLASGVALHVISRVAESLPRVRFRGLAEVMAYWPVAAVLTAALGVLGGLIA